MRITSYECTQLLTKNMSAIEARRNRKKDENKLNEDLCLLKGLKAVLFDAKIKPHYYDRIGGNSKAAKEQREQNLRLFDEGITPISYEQAESIRSIIATMKNSKHYDYLMSIKSNEYFNVFAGEIELSGFCDFIDHESKRIFKIVLLPEVDYDSFNKFLEINKYQPCFDRILFDAPNYSYTYIAIENRPNYQMQYFKVGEKTLIRLQVLTDLVLKEFNKQIEFKNNNGFYPTYADNIDNQIELSEWKLRK